MVINFIMCTSRPSARQWSLISLCVHQDPLQGNDLGFSLHWGPLRDNGHQFLYIKAFCEAVVIDFFITSRPFARRWSSISLHQDLVWVNGHWFLYFWYRSSPHDWSNLFFKKSKNNKKSDLSDRDPLHDNGHRIFWM